jgi:hypothetical protein
VRHSAERVVAAACTAIGIDLYDVTKRNGEGQMARTKRPMHERRLIAWLARDISGASYPEIARAMGIGWHSTILALVAAAIREIPPQALADMRARTLAVLASGDERIGDGFGPGVIRRKG